MSGRSMASEMFGKTYIVKVLDDGECITEGELIRCKDCKYWMPRQICLAYDTPQNYCEKHMPDDDFYAEIWNSNDFCSKAERKDND